MGVLRPRLVLAVICAAQFLVVLITVVNVALPAIREDLAIAPGQLHWAISAYAVAYGGRLQVAGRLADTPGRRRVFLGGVALFGAASLVCGPAPSGDVLAASRAFQGVGASLVTPAALAVLAQAFGEGRPRVRALAVWGTVGALAAASGVLLRGILVELLDWRWIFLVNVPVAAAALALGLAVFPPHRGRAGRRIDLTGALLVTAVPALAVAGLASGLLNTPQWVGGAVGAAAVSAAGAGTGLWACALLGAAGTAVALATLLGPRGAPVPAAEGA